MLVCGTNKFSELNKTSTTKNVDGKPAVDQPIKHHLSPSLFSSFSTNNGQTVWISHDGKSYVTGNNNNGKICGSLPHETLPEDTEFILRDPLGQPCKFISVVCGYYYTLYLVSSESGPNNFKLVMCYQNRPTNPLFVNIENRIPIALFGGEETSGVIDIEGGIIIISEGTTIYRAAFLPDGDKPVKLACGNVCVLALGMSGKVYESRIPFLPGENRRINFEEVKELSDSNVIDISGPTDFFLAVLKDGRVYGRGFNESCKLGLPFETKEVSKFTLIESLSKYKIVSVYTGAQNSIFKTSENKMIVLGSNCFGQLFIPINNINNKFVYTPLEIPICQGFTFCVTGTYSTVAFFGMEAPLNFPNKKIVIQNDLRRENDELMKNLLKRDEEISILKEKNSELKTEKDKEITKLEVQNKEYEKNLKKNEKEISKLKAKNKEYKSRQKKKEKEISDLKEELMQLKKKIKETSDNSQLTPLNKEFQILDDDEINELETIEEIYSNGNGKILKVAKKTIYVLKVMKNRNITHKQLQHFVAEYEIMNALDHPNILKSYGIFYGNDEMHASILLEYCPQNLDEAIKNKTLSKVERVCSIYEIASGMKFVHFNHIIHRDIKPSNILISKDGHMKISDFGISKLVSFDDESMTLGIGTQKFMAPEIINEEEYSYKVDVYSFGVLIYFIISNGKMPKITITQVGNGKKAEIPSDFTEFAHELIDSCWNFNPKDRPDFENICSQLKDKTHQLLDLTPSEIKEVKIFIENHNIMIPHY